MGWVLIGHVKHGDSDDDHMTWVNIWVSYKAI